MNLSPDVVFQAANGLALIAWMALLASPPAARWHGLTWRLTGRLLPFAFGVVYVAMLALHWPEGGGFGSIQAVQVLFASPGALAAGWLHYLAFDLFVGTWIAEDASSSGLRHWMVAPLLVLTFMFGPAGLVAYLLLRAMRRSRAAAAPSVSMGASR